MGYCHLMEHLPLPRFLTTRETARLFGVSIMTVTRWAHEGKLLWGRSPGGHFRFISSQPRIAARLRQLEEHGGHDNPVGP